MISVASLFDFRMTPRLDTDLTNSDLPEENELCVLLPPVRSFSSFLITFGTQVLHGQNRKEPHTSCFCLSIFFSVAAHPPSSVASIPGDSYLGEKVRAFSVWSQGFCSLGCAIWLSSWPLPWISEESTEWNAWGSLSQEPGMAEPAKQNESLVRFCKQRAVSWLVPGSQWCLASVLLVEIYVKEQTDFVLVTFFWLDGYCVFWMDVIYGAKAAFAQWFPPSCRFTLLCWFLFETIGKLFIGKKPPQQNMVALRPANCFL